MVVNKVFIVGDNWGYGEMFTKKGWTIVKKVEEADLVQFCGGEDVSPELYGEDTHPETYNSIQRDLEEKELFTYCLKLDKPMAGICRGGQFLNVMSGGRMYQHVDGHALAGCHGVSDIETGWTMNCSSTHHQMMRPSTTAEIVAVAHSNLSTYKDIMLTDDHLPYNICGHDSLCDDVDYEVVWYEATKCLCFQPHPEFAGVYDCTKYYFQLIERKFGL